MAIGALTDLSIGKFLKIVSKGAVYNNLSEDSELWDNVKKFKKGDAEGRELRYLLRSDYGAASAGFLPLSGGDYPAAVQGEVSEGTTIYKDYAVTIEVERTVIAKAISDLSSYGKPLAEELRAKTIALSRLLSIRALAGGDGVVAEMDSAAASSNQILITLATDTDMRGFVGWIEPGDKLVAYSQAGVEVEPDAATSYEYLKVENIVRDTTTPQVLVSARTSAGVQINQSAATNYVDGTYLYRYQQHLNGNISDISAVATSTDRNSLSEGWCGLADLSEDDNRKVNGINLTGALGGTRRSCGGSQIDSQDFQKLLSQLMIACGQGRYRYNSALMAWECLDALIESRETDRRFQNVTDNKRGVSGMGYVHGRNTVMFKADEFVPFKRVYVLPEGDVLQFHGSDFDFVKPEGGQKFFLSNASSGVGHSRSVRAYMEGQGAFMSVHSAAIGTLENFTV